MAQHRTPEATIRTEPLRAGLALAFLLAAPASAEVTIAAEEIEPPALAEMPCLERPYSVLVTVTNIRESRGTITLDLHDDNPERWLKKGEQIARVRVPAVKGETRMCVPILAAGTYAIGLYHDRNGDRRFDKNFLGIPSEPFGVSNNPTIGFSAPSLESAEFKVEGRLTPLTIRLR